LVLLLEQDQMPQEAVEAVLQTLVTTHRDQLEAPHEVQEPPQEADRMMVTIPIDQQPDQAEAQHDLPDPLDHHRRHVPHVRPHDREAHLTTDQAHQVHVQPQHGRLAGAQLDHQEEVDHFEEINFL
jgi:hypothetical protein